MNRALKILRLFAIIIVTLSIILFSASYLLQGKVADIILKSLNKNISTKMDVGSFKLSFLKKFPKASLELKDVLIHSSRNFNAKSFPGINTDTLLAAKFLSVEFRITDIMKGIYNIERIGVHSGIINLYIDTAGFYNYDVSVKKKNQGEENFTINLERIYINDIRTNYNNLAIKLKLTGIVKNGKLKSRISGNDIDFMTLSDIQISGFQLRNTILSKPFNARLDIELKSSESGIMFKKSTLRIEKNDFFLTGFISADDLFDLKITGNNIDISKIKSYLPEKYFTLFSDYDLSGILSVNSKIKGTLSKVSNPHIEVDYNLNKGHITHRKLNMAIDDLSFTGAFSNGSKNCSETSSVSIKDFKTRLASSQYKGSFLLSDFDNPKTQIILNGIAFPHELKEFFGIKNISSAEGSVDIDLKLVTDLWPFKRLTFNVPCYLKPEGNLSFDSFTLGFKNDSLFINKLCGSVRISNSILAKKLEFTYRGQRIKVDGEFINLPEWIAGKPVQLNATANISINKLSPQLFFKNSLSSDAAEQNKIGITFPRNIKLDINFSIDSLVYKTFSASHITGNLNYKPRLLTFKSLNMFALNGLISGNGFVDQRNNKSLTARGNFIVKDIDVNKTFLSLQNFGQNFIKAENIEGTLSGTFSVLLPMDSLMNPQVKEVTAEGKYQLINGALINFEPVKKLSSFIELSELENIHFDKLENDFYIKNNFMYIPQMDVKSTAVDLSVYGKHSFDNNYEYHVKMLLSEILSKKRKKKNTNTEFGFVEDDGLGRTSILLKIKNKGTDVKIGYDLKAAGDKVIVNFKSERESLKKILNQEYGWYKNDTTAKQKPDVKSPRFKISWGEPDSEKKPPDIPVSKKKSEAKKKFIIE